MGSGLDSQQMMTVLGVAAFLRPHWSRNLEEWLVHELMASGQHALLLLSEIASVENTLKNLWLFFFILSLQ